MIKIPALRTNVLLTLWIITLLLLASHSIHAKQPNIVLFFADDAGYADFGFQGSKTHPTPHLDKMAEEGLRFTRAYVSGPVCSPSRSGLLTGRYQQRFGAGNNLPNPHPLGLPLTEKLMPEYLKDLGYGNYMIGKWHQGVPEPYQPQNRGFDKFFGILEGARSYFQKKSPSYGKALVENGKTVDEPKDLYVTDKFGDKAVEYIETHMNENPDQPFFLFFSFTAPHNPMHGKKEDLAALEGVEFEDKDRKINAAMTLAMDRQVGRVVEALEKGGQLENTLIVFLNDNGGALKKNGSINDPLFGWKGSFFEGGVRVPMFVTWPGKVGEGKTFEGITSGLDLLPTFVSAAGGKVDPAWNLDGVDLLPFLKGEAEGNPHDELYWRDRGVKGRKAMLMWPWKYLTLENNKERLFNLDEDPRKRNDLSAKKPEILAEMKAKYAEWEAPMKQPLWWWNEEMEKEFATDE